MPALFSAAVTCSQACRLPRELSQVTVHPQAGSAGNTTHTWITDHHFPSRVGWCVGSHKRHVLMPRATQGRTDRLPPGAAVYGRDAAARGAEHLCCALAPLPQRAGHLQLPGPCAGQVLSILRPVIPTPDTHAELQISQVPAEQGRGRGCLLPKAAPDSFGPEALCQG